MFVVACDMPFLKHEMISFFVKRDSDADIVMGRLHTGLQPLHAVYGKRVLPFLGRMVETGHLKIQDILSEPSLKITVVNASEWASIDPASQSFQNVNTPADLDTARGEASRSSLAQ